MTAHSFSASTMAHRSAATTPSHRDAESSPAADRSGFSSQRPSRRARRRAGVAGSILGLLALSFGLSGVAHALATPVPEGDARNFAVLAGSTITNANVSTVSGDIGLHPGTSITGYGPGANQITHTGEVHATNAVALSAKHALTGAYNDAAAQTTEFPIGPALAGSNLTEGVYASTSGAFLLDGTMTLTGDADAIFIFKMDSTLTAATGSSIVLAGDVDACNVYWQVGESATLETGSSFVGTVMADQSITMNSAASLNGRLWASVGAVTLDNNTIANPCFVSGATGEGTGVPTDGDTGGDTDAQVTIAPSGGVATGDGSTLVSGDHGTPR